MFLSLKPAVPVSQTSSCLRSLGHPAPNLSSLPLAPCRLQVGHTAIFQNLILQGMAPPAAGLAAGLPTQVGVGDLRGGWVR